MSTPTQRAEALARGLAGQPNVEYGDPEVAYGNEILRTVVGSGVHGIAIEGTDDHDEMGIYVEEMTTVFGPSQGLDFHLGQPKRRREDFIYRTQPEGARSGPGDIDRVLYGLRKFLALAIKGNPTVLLPLYAPASDVLVETPLGQELRDMRPLFLSQQAVHRFLGYMHSQHERMMGQGKRNRVPKRPELIEQYGWDTKFGSHALRLAYQGREIARDGYLTLPMAEAERERVLAVKRGEIPREKVDRQIGAIEAQIIRMLELGQVDLPVEADVETITNWSVTAHRRTWGWW